MLTFFLYELKSEFRQRLSFLSILLYTFSISYLIYFLMGTQGALLHLEKRYWNIIFWMVVLYSIIQHSVSQFSRETNGIYLYYFTLLKPEQFIWTKILYNIVYTIVLILIIYGVFILWFGNPIQNVPVFLTCVLLGAISFSILFCMTSSISRGLQNLGVLSSILGFPLAIPLVTLVAKIAREGFVLEASDNLIVNLSILIGFDVLLFALALILYPYIWRE